MNHLKLGLIVLFLSANLGFSQAKKDADLTEKASEWVKDLNLDNTSKEQSVTDIIATHLTAVRHWHNNHPFETVPAGINPKTGEKLSDLDRSIIADSAMPSSVHDNLMSGLRGHLTEEQVEAILDKYTIGKVTFTMKAYREIVTDMTPKEDAELLKNLKEAREIAVDFKQMKQISAIFEIYKTKNEQYLNNNGRSWRQLYKDYVKRLRAMKKKN
ncbi:DUF3826 domain-containing protein [Flavobacteriaceae bacterium GSB9]|nr:DUF3826 domain-containing protein [Flavobacteriaceae bacterium GSB9]